MSKELKHQVALKSIGDLKVEGVYIRTTDEYKFVKSILDVYDEARPLNAKNNLALEIIKIHRIYVGALFSSNIKCADDYNQIYGDNLTQWEYDLLKEVLSDVE